MTIFSHLEFLVLCSVDEWIHTTVEEGGVDGKVIEPTS